MKLTLLSGMPRANELMIMKSPAIKSRTFKYIRDVVSDPLDLSFGVVLTAYTISSLYEVCAEFWISQKSAVIRMSQKKIIQDQKFILKFFAVANLFKWIDWVGKSKVTGIKEYAFPRLSAIADVFYIYTYGYGCVNNRIGACQARKARLHHLSNVKSKKHYQAIEMKELAGYISNYSYVCFSGMSLGVFFINTTLLASTMTGAMAVYFLFLAIEGVAAVAAEEASIKNKNIHWIKGEYRRGGAI